MDGNDDFLKHMRLVARTEGIVVGPDGGATSAAARHLISSGTLSAEDRILLLNTGSALKNLELM